MLCIKEYSRQELIEMYHTDRIDSIKQRLTREGYQYTTQGRGANFTLTITACPSAFVSFCKNELGFAPQTDFKRLRIFYNNFIFDEEFRQLPYTEMVRRLAKKGIVVTETTISNWIKKLIDNNLIYASIAEFNYYASHYTSETGLYSLPITEQQYKEGWAEYWASRDNNETYTAAMNKLFTKTNGTPFKRPKIIENAFETEKFDKLVNILKEE